MDNRSIKKRAAEDREGTALIIALWVILLMTLLIGSFAFDMHIEAGITSYYRKRLKSEYLAQGGIELAKSILAQELTEEEKEAAEDGDEMAQARERFAQGGIIQVNRELGAGKLELTIYPAEARRNVNQLSEEDWDDLLEISGVPDDLKDELIDCFFDWIDENDLHRLNGAESDDDYYKDQEYLVKNAALDTVDELLLIKGFSKPIVYGGLLDEDTGDYVQGIARNLTTWGDCLNPNSASRETLMTLPGILEWQADAILEYRSGPDGADGTEDDQIFESVDEMIDLTGTPEDLREYFCVQEPQYIRIVSIGSVGSPRSLKRVVSCIMRFDQNEMTLNPVYWREEHVP